MQNCLKFDAIIMNFVYSGIYTPCPCFLMPIFHNFGDIVLTFCIKLSSPLINHKIFKTGA